MPNVFMLLTPSKQGQKVSSPPGAICAIFYCLGNSSYPIYIYAPVLLLSLETFFTGIPLMCNYSCLCPFHDYLARMLLKNCAYQCHHNVTKYLHAVGNCHILESRSKARYY